jgi:hypothetical protein
MDWPSIALYLSMKRLSGKEDHQELARTLSAVVVAYPTVTWYLRAAISPAQSKEARGEAGVTRIGSLDAAVLKALTDNPFPAVRELSRLTCLSRSTVHQRLPESVGFNVHHLH